LKDTKQIEDIAEKLETNKKLFADEEEENGIDYNEFDDEEEEAKLSYVGQQIDDKMGSPELRQKKAGRRSDAFDFLLNKENAPTLPKSRYSMKRDNYEQYVNDLAQGDIELQKEEDA